MATVPPDIRHFLKVASGKIEKSCGEMLMNCPNLFHSLVPTQHWPFLFHLLVLTQHSAFCFTVTDDNDFIPLQIILSPSSVLETVQWLLLAYIKYLAAFFCYTNV